MTLELKFGCDPEFFLQDPSGRFINAYGMFPGTKNDPHKLEKGTIQVDGTALEIGIDPASTEDEFNSNIDKVLEQTKELIFKVSPALRPVFVPIARFDPNYWTFQPLESKFLGCEPDYGTDGEQKTPNENAMYDPIRAAGGHVHISWTKGKELDDEVHFEDCRNVAENFLKVKYYSPESADEKLRVVTYGTPGSFRPKSYGVELRSPSNIWVENEETRREIFRLTKAKMEEIFAR